MRCFRHRIDAADACFRIDVRILWRDSGGRFLRHVVVVLQTIQGRVSDMLRIRDIA
jgi:hypothetical protein